MGNDIPKMCALDKILFLPASLKAFMSRKKWYQRLANISTGSHCLRHTTGFPVHQQPFEMLRSNILKSFVTEVVVPFLTQLTS